MVRQGSAKPLFAGSIPAQASKNYLLVNTGMKSEEILKKYLNYYISKGHKQIPNVSLVPEGDSTLLFVNSGMFPLVPYLSGEPHPLGKRLVNVQRSLRFEDIEDVGNTNRHTIAFHMLGNWSLGDYFKKEQLLWIYEFLIEGLKLDPNKLFATVFAGDEYAPKDEESAEIIKEVMKKYGIDASEGVRIFPCGRKDNWWQRGESIGELGGPDSEIFYYVGEGSYEGKSPSENQDDFLEIGNSVFMQYRKIDRGWEPLSQKNVDFGGGLERLALVTQGRKDIFETDNFWPLIDRIQKISGRDYHESSEVKRSMRILADHMRASVMLAMDGVLPGNKDQGYILRRIIRRMIKIGRNIGVEKNIPSMLIDEAVSILDWLYPSLKDKKTEIINIFSTEEEKFFKVLSLGIKESEKIISRLNDKDFNDPDKLADLSFNLFQSLGYPPDIFLEDMKNKGKYIDSRGFNKAVDSKFKKHQELSRSGSEMKFKGGLMDQSERTVKYHTATHILQRGLINILGNHICQLGSNITNERLRYDFPNPAKLTDQQIKELENYFNDIVIRKIPVNFIIMPKRKAQEIGAMYLKNESYPDEVKVYYIGDSIEKAVSKEFCGGPHVQNTSELGGIEIYKQEKIGDGKMRIYARFK